LALIVQPAGIRGRSRLDAGRKTCWYRSRSTR
jgi:hypothetical protein